MSERWPATVRTGATPDFDGRDRDSASPHRFGAPNPTCASRFAWIRLALFVVWVLAIGLACATPRNLDAWHQHLLDADAEFDDRADADAEARYAALLPSAPDVTLARYIRFRLAIIEARSHDLQAGIDSLARLEAEENPLEDEWTSQSRFWIGKLLDEEAGDRQAALDVWVDLVVRYPDSAAARRAFAYILEEFRDQGDTSGAIEWLADAYLKLEGTDLADNALYEMGNRFDQLGDQEMAQELLMQLRIRYRDGPLFDDATWRLAEIAEDEGRLDDALAMYEVIAERHDSSWRLGVYDSKLRDDCMLARARIFEQLSQWEPAIEEYARLLEAFPKYTDGGKYSFRRAELIRVHRADEQAYVEALDALIEHFDHSIYAEQALWRLERLEAGIPLADLGLPEHARPRPKPWLDDADE